MVGITRVKRCLVVRLAVCALAALPAAACKNRSDDAALKAAPDGRKIIGAAAPYDANLALKPDPLAASMVARRAAGWDVIRRALRPVTLQLSAGGDPLTIPTWQTWYEGSEFESMFKDLWSRLSPAQKRGEQPVDPAMIDLVVLAQAQQPLPAWWNQADHFMKRLGQLKTVAAADGLGGLNGFTGEGITLFSPGLVKHMLANFATMVKCTASLPRDASPPHPANFAPCYSAPFPADAVAVKTTWIPEGDPVAVYDTSGAGLKRYFDGGDWNFTPAGTPPDQGGPTMSTTDDMIYSVTTGNGKKFKLAGLHFTTKELPNWLWVTVWWSNTPDDDFGADRPADLEANAAWRNYKMCDVSDFDEHDPLTAASLDGLKPSLVDAILASDAAAHPHTRCSNPFIEFSPGKNLTNCIGCHQHAGPEGVVPAECEDPKMPPAVCQGQSRQTFMTDFLWSFNASPDFYKARLLNVIKLAPPPPP